MHHVSKNFAKVSLASTPLRGWMKAIVIFALLLAPSAHAAWSDLKAGLDPKTAGQLVGAPLFENRTRGWTFVNWVFDNGGFILFENGRVKYWQAPRELAAVRVARESNDVKSKPASRAAE